MDVMLMFIFIVCFYLLPAVPAVLFYMLSPRATREKARTVAAYGPISVKFGGAAALYLAFFFLLNQTPLMTELKKRVRMGDVSLKGRIAVTISPDVAGDEALRQKLIEAFRDLKQATVCFEPPTKVDTKGPRFEKGQAINEFEIMIPRSWIKHLQSRTDTKLQIDPRKTQQLTPYPIEITKASLADDVDLNREEITLRDIKIDLFSRSRETETEQMAKTKSLGDKLSKTVIDDPTSDPYAKKPERSWR